MEWTLELLDLIKEIRRAFMKKNIVPEYQIMYIDGVKMLSDELSGYFDLKFRDELYQNLDSFKKKYAQLKAQNYRKYKEIHEKEQQVEAHRILFQNLIKLMKRKGFLPREGITSVMKTAGGTQTSDKPLEEIDPSALVREYSRKQDKLGHSEQEKRQTIPGLPFEL